MSDAVMIAAIGAIVSLASLAMTLLIKKDVNAYHKTVNGKMGELLQVTKEASKAEGKLENQAETDAKKQKDK